jgi:hypothetical protein
MVFFVRWAGGTGLVMNIKSEPLRFRRRQAMEKRKKCQDGLLLHVQCCFP